MAVLNRWFLFFWLIWIWNYLYVQQITWLVILERSFKVIDRIKIIFIIVIDIGSPWRDKISLAILELQEKGVIQILYDKWWKNTGDVCNRDDKNKESKANALGVENIGKMSAAQSQPCFYCGDYLLYLFS